MLLFHHSTQHIPFHSPFPPPFRPFRGKIFINMAAGFLEGSSDLEKLHNLCKKTHKEQAVWFLNAFWEDFAEGEAENLWRFVDTIHTIDNAKAAGTELDELEAHRFLEKADEAHTVLEMRNRLRKTGAIGENERPKTVPLSHYLLFKYDAKNANLFHELVTRSQGDNQKQIEEAQAKLDAVQAAFDEASRTADVAAAALKEAKAREADAKARESEAVEAENAAKSREADAKAREADAKAREADALEAESQAKQRDEAAKKSEAAAKEREAAALESAEDAKSREAAAKASAEQLAVRQLEVIATDTLPPDLCCSLRQKELNTFLLIA